MVITYRITYFLENINKKMMFFGKKVIFVIFRAGFSVGKSKLCLAEPAGKKTKPSPPSNARSRGFKLKNRHYAKKGYLDEVTHSIVRGTTL